MASLLVPNAPLGTCLPLHLKAAVWVNRALNLLDRGRVLLFDYGLQQTKDFVERPSGEWIRTYSEHHRAGNPYTEAGSRDITCDVAFDQLPGSPKIVAQRDWLLSQGLHAMTEWAREKWYDAAAAPDSEALGARAVLEEAAALTDREGLGAFLVAEWQVGE
jgi:SAM-dependent MidA family methyltransferase